MTTKLPNSTTPTTASFISRPPSSSVAIGSSSSAATATGTTGAAATAVGRAAGCLVGNGVLVVTSVGQTVNVVPHCLHRTRLPTANGFVVFSALRQCGQTILVASIGPFLGR